MTRSTIFALSSGSLPSGVAVIRVSGPQVVSIIDMMIGQPLTARAARLVKLHHPHSGELLDEAVALLFRAPASFTGEDVLELQCHGGVATVSAVLAALGSVDGLEGAERGDFSRRAFENGKLDLTELEGLSDIVAAQTEQQRKLALSQAGGSLRKLYDDWRDQLIRMRALVEAEIDFADEDDVPGSVSSQVWQEVSALAAEMAAHLQSSKSGEIIRRGFKIALLGAPNAGKSSLLNALANRDAAIVTDQPGTTRDIIEVSLNIGGHLVVVSDTAGIRDAADVVEREGIRRAFAAAEQADLAFWLQAADNAAEMPVNMQAVVLKSKVDLAPSISEDSLSVSTLAPGGLDVFLAFLRSELKKHTPKSEEPVATRHRHSLLLADALVALRKADDADKPLELRSEDLRLAAESLGRLTGRIDVEDLLDVIFSEFCIGK